MKPGMKRGMKRERASSSTGDVAMALVAFLGLVVSGCQPGVGSGCTLSTDCGTTGALVCDTSEFQGYCTVEDCVPDECPNSAACVLFNPVVPGCGPDDYNQGSRISAQFCMATCGSNSNCRDGYECANPTLAPWYADILDNTYAGQSVMVCIPIPLETLEVGGGDAAALLYSSPDAAVCRTGGSPFDASSLFDAWTNEETYVDSGADGADTGD